MFKYKKSTESGTPATVSSRRRSWDRILFSCFSGDPPQDVQKVRIHQISMTNDTHSETGMPFTASYHITGDLVTQLILGTGTSIINPLIIIIKFHVVPCLTRLPESHLRVIFLSFFQTFNLLYNVHTLAQISASDF